MKKILSLVLSLTMVLSMATVSAGAKEFTDDGEISYAEAVAVISEIGVVDGYTDGSFGPTSQLTRGAAAKIICNLLLGPTTASALSADTAPFKDVSADHTFAGYIAYCAQKGIISGYTDGTFRPAAPLTGYAFLKMLLGGLGYDGDIEGFTGSNWSVNVAKLAMGNKLTQGNENFVGTRTVTREEACQYAFNTLKADMVEYDAKTSVSVNGAQIVVGGSEAKKIADEKAAGYEDTLEKENLQFAEKHFPKLKRTQTAADAFGRPAAEWKYKSTVIGTYADNRDLLGSYADGVSKGDLYSLVGASVVKGFTDEKDPYTLTIWEDGEQVGDNENVADYFVKNSSGTAIGKGALAEVYMDDDNNVNIVIVNTYLAQATADYNTKKETLSIEVVEINEEESVTPVFKTTISNDDLDVSEFSEDDYILVTYSHETGAIESVEAAEIVTGEVSEYTEGKNVIIDGDKYTYNHLVGEVEKDKEFTIGENAQVILDSHGYILYVKEAVSTGSYVYIADTADTTGLKKNVVAAAYFTDGTYEEVSLKKVDSKTGHEDLMDASGWYTYSRSGDKLVLTSVKDPMDQSEIVTFEAGETITTNGKVQFMDGVKGNSSTVFVVLDSNDDVTVYTGVAKVPTITMSEDAEGTAKVQYVEKNGYAKYVFIDVSADAEASIDDTDSVADYLMILKSTGKKTVSGEDTYYQYEVVIDGEETTRYINEYILTENGSLYYNVKENDKGFITNATPFGGKGVQETIELKDTTIQYSSDTLTIGENSYIVDDKCQITLAIGPNAEELLKDVDADYELYQDISAKALAGLVKGYDLTGSAFVEVDETGSDIMVNLHIWVSGASESAE